MGLEGTLGARQVASMVTSQGSSHCEVRERESQKFKGLKGASATREVGRVSGEVRSGRDPGPLGGPQPRLAWGCLSSPHALTDTLTSSSYLILRTPCKVSIIPSHFIEDEFAAQRG